MIKSKKISERYPERYLSGVVVSSKYSHCTGPYSQSSVNIPETDPGNIPVGW